ncbi:MAG: hypothetical protein Q8L51_02415, partial [Candidatus Amesbacteria bacterium]|nr:hypothetical protein [Candidatus Amesbacteria bacterium]
MRKFLPVLIALILLAPRSLGVVGASHNCAGYNGGDGVCNQYTEQGACTHGCYEGGDPNPSYHQDTENYVGNGPNDDEILRQSQEAAKRSSDAEAATKALLEKQRNDAIAIDAALKSKEVTEQQKNNIKGIGQCDGWADNGSEHRNSGNGCFYTCESGSWKGPNKCDGQGNGLFQLPQSFLDLSPQQIADEVAKRQWEAYVQTLKQDGKQLVKDEKGEYKKNTDGYITEDIPG